MRKQRTIILAVLVFAFFSGICGAGSASSPRPSDWAKPVKMEGVPNLYKVSDNLYRSAQPTSAEALYNLETSNLRIRTVVNLSLSQSDRDKIGGTGLVYEHIPITGWPLFPKEGQVIHFLQIVTDKKRTPVLVHCRHGADRTGIMCAIYRIAIQGWTKERALREMIEGGFGFHGSEDGNMALWINKLDIFEIKEKAGIRGGTLH